MVFLPTLGFPHKLVCYFFVVTFNIVSERDKDETLDDTTLDGTRTEETAETIANIHAAVDVRIAVTMEDFFRRLQSTLIGSDPLPHAPWTSSLALNQPQTSTHVPICSLLSNQSLTTVSL